MGKTMATIMAIAGGATMIALAFFTQRSAWECVMIGGGVGAMGGGVAANLFMEKIVALRQAKNAGSGSTDSGTGA